MERQFNIKIKVFHSDCSGEYQRLHKYFTQISIIHRIACPYTHEQNGTAERKIHHIVDTVLLAHSSVPLKYWNFSFATAASLINTLSSSVHKNHSPFFLLYNKSPSYYNLHPFGYTIFPLLHPYNNKKFSYRTKTCVY